jgi:hypothetical protein
MGCTVSVESVDDAFFARQKKFIELYVDLVCSMDYIAVNLRKKTYTDLYTFTMKQRYQNDRDKDVFTVGGYGENIKTFSYIPHLAHFESDFDDNYFRTIYDLHIIKRDVEDHVLKEITTKLTERKTFYIEELKNEETEIEKIKSTVGDLETDKIKSTYALMEKNMHKTDVASILRQNDIVELYHKQCREYKEKKEKIDEVSNKFKVMKCAITNIELFLLMA